MARVSDSDIYLRTKCVQDWLNQGFSNKTIHSLLESKFDLKTYKTRNNVIKAATHEIRYGIDAEDIKAANSERLEAICEKAMEKGEFTSAIRAIDVNNKLHGLYVEKKEVEVTSNTFKINFGE